MPRAPNILFLMTDHTSARVVAPESQCLTTHLDALAAEGVRFARSAPAVDASAWRKALAAFREPERFVAGQLFGDTPEALTTASVSVAELNILLDRMTRVRLASDPPDVTVSSEIGGIALLEFDRAEDAIRIGAEATKRVLPEIEALAKSRRVEQ